MGTEGQVAIEPGEAELPPMMEQFLQELKSDRKKLLKDKAFKDPEQLRGFIGQFLFPRLVEFVQMMGGAIFDTYGLAVSNATQQQRMHAFFVEELRKLGSDVRPGDQLPGVGVEALDRFHQAFYALGAVLQKKLPDDKETEEAWNRCASGLAEMVEELMGSRGRDEDYYDDDDDDDEEEERPSRRKRRRQAKDDDTDGAESDDAESDSADAEPEKAEADEPEKADAPAPEGEA